MMQSRNKMRLWPKKDALMNGWLHHIDITVRDLGRSTEFYGRVLPHMGFRRALDVPEGPVWAGAQTEIGLVKAHAGSAPDHDRYAPGLHHLAFAAPERDAVDELHRTLHALGVTVLDPPAQYDQYAPGYYAVFFADPDGIKLEYVFTPK
jgi:glyoxylase I family protein